jgi:hypothetical protein
VKSATIENVLLAAFVAALAAYFVTKTEGFVWLAFATGLPMSFLTIRRRWKHG